MGAQTQHKARPQRKARLHVRKLGAPTQHKARPQCKARHVRNENARHVRNLGAPTQRKARPQDGRPNAKPIRNENVHTREHWAKRRAGGWIRTNFGLEVDFLIRPHQGWAPQHNRRHVRKMGAQTQHKARPQVGRPNATQGTSASWTPQRTSATQTQDTQRKARPHVRKLGAPTQRKARPQDGRPNAKLILNESVHTREH
jgi:hypothetical protein